MLAPARSTALIYARPIGLPPRRVEVLRPWWINGDFLGGGREKSAVRPRCLFEFTLVDATK
jgi:hypothetical protein